MRKHELLSCLWLFGSLLKTEHMGKPWNNESAEKWWACGRHVRQKELAPSAKVRRTTPEVVRKKLSLSSGNISRKMEVLRGKTPLERWYPSAGSIYLTQARARNAPGTGQSTPTSKNQEFGGLQPRDERSRHPSLGLPRVQ